MAAGPITATSESGKIEVRPSASMCSPPTPATVKAPGPFFSLSAASSLPPSTSPECSPATIKMRFVSGMRWFPETLQTLFAVFCGRCDAVKEEACLIGFFHKLFKLREEHGASFDRDSGEIGFGGAFDGA